MEILYGLHPVEEALRAGSRQFDHVSVAKERHDQKLQRIVDACRDAGVRLRFEPREHLTRLAKTAAHQGVVAVVRGKTFLDIEDLLTPQTEPRLLVALDGVEDPQNLGALLRTAEGAGVDGVVLTERRSAPLSPVAVKASAGAAEHIRIARVVNLVRAIEQIKQQGVWCIGLDERGSMDYDQFDYSTDCVLVLGREGAGLHDLVKRTCDHLLRIPMAGKVASLNVSAAGAVVLYEAARQRRAACSRCSRRGTSEKGRRKEAEGFGSMKFRHRLTAALAGTGLVVGYTLLLSGLAVAQQSQASPAAPPAAASASQEQNPAPESAPNSKVIFSRSASEDSAETQQPESGKSAKVEHPAAKATDAERAAVTYTAYDLDVRLRPDEHALAVEAQVTIRNDGAQPLKQIPLQLSSSLHWETIESAGKPLKFGEALLEERCRPHRRGSRGGGSARTAP